MVPKGGTILYLWFMEFIQRKFLSVENILRGFGFYFDFQGTYSLECSVMSSKSERYKGR